MEVTIILLNGITGEIISSAKRYDEIDAYDLMLDWLCPFLNEFDTLSKISKDNETIYTIRHYDDSYGEMEVHFIK